MLVIARLYTFACASFAREIFVTSRFCPSLQRDNFQISNCDWPFMKATELYFYVQNYSCTLEIKFKFSFQFFFSIANFLFWGNGGGAVVKALPSHQCSNSRVDAVCRLSFLLVQACPCFEDFSSGLSSFPPSTNIS